MSPPAADVMHRAAEIATPVKAALGYTGAFERFGGTEAKLHGRGFR